jgi:hypothetical protein
MKARPRRIGQRGTVYESHPQKLGGRVFQIQAARVAENHGADREFDARKSLPNRRMCCVTTAAAATARSS